MTAKLRLLATSDLHMQLLDFDYIQDTPSKIGSLARLAALIETARADSALCLLVDNGDTLQGTPVADYLQHSANGVPHPMVQAMNALRYDVVGLGNHDLDFGVQALAQILEQFDAPVVSSNLTSDMLPMVRSSVILERAIPGPDGRTLPLRIGFVSALPQMTASWNRHHLQDRATLTKALPAIDAAATAVRAAGADLVIALAHMGIATGEETEAPQNQIIEVANLPHVDAVIGGHTHLRFPGPDHGAVDGVDCRRGLIGGTPVVLPGSAGSDLGQIDLNLAWDTDGWQVTSCQSALRPAVPSTPENARIDALASKTHDRTRKFLAARVGRIDTPMHTYFALVQPSSVASMIGAAKAAAVRTVLAGSPLLDRQALLSAAAPPATGGFDGPQNFVAFAPGALLRRHIAGLNRYANQVWAVRTTGARLKDWLERAALVYNTLDPSNPDQNLLNPRVPGFNFDAIFGLTYTIDPTLPPAFDSSGNRPTGAPGRILDLRWQGEPVDPQQTFIVATSDHRAGGGGNHAAFSDTEVVFRGALPIEEALLAYFRNSTAQADPLGAPWRLRPGLGISARMTTAPAALHHLDEIAEFRPEVCGTTDDGFLQLRLHL